MRKDIFISIVLFFLTFFIVGKNLTKPFFGIHDWNGARYGNIARNYIRYGFFTTKFSQVENSGVAAPKDFQYLTHYPPLLPILISISYRIFGINEWATRLVALFATSGSIILVYLVGRTIFDWKVGVGASLLALATPMIRYFGKNPVHEPLALFFALISFFGCALVLKENKKGWLLLYLGLVLTVITNWSGVFLLLGITIILFRKVGILKLINLWLLTAVLVGLHFLHIYLITGSLAGGGIFQAFLQRTSIGGAANLTKFNLLEFVNRLRLWSSTLYTVTLLIFSSIGLYFLIKKESFEKRVFFSGLTIYGLGCPLLFPNATFIHNYFIFGITPTLALLASLAIFSITKNEKTKILLLIMILAMVWFERKPFLDVLEKSQNDFLAYEIGRKINTTVSTNESILVTPFDFAASRLPHLSFYSDRKITLNPKSSYNWVIEVNEQDRSYKILRRER